MAVVAKNSPDPANGIPWIAFPSVPDGLEFIIDQFAQGWPESEILRNYPGLTSQDIQACLAYASATLRAEKVYPMAV